MNNSVLKRAMHILSPLAQSNVDLREKENGGGRTSATDTCYEQINHLFDHAASLALDCVDEM